MTVQQIGLNYGWLVDLARMQAEAEMYEKELKARTPATPQATAIKEARTPQHAILGGPTYAAGKEEKTTYQLEKEQRREDVLAEQTRKHEIALKQMDIDAKLAEAMSKEKIAGIGAEAGVEQAGIAGAAQVGAAQKTTIEKGYEFVEMLMGMDEKSANELIANLEARRTEGQVERPISTITAGGITKELPGTTPAGDPNDPLTWLEAVGAYTPGAEAVRPKPTGAAAKPEIDQYLDLIDDMLDKNPQSIVAITTGKGWDELKETMRAIGAEGGFSEDVINAGVSMYEALVPEYEEPEEGGGLGGAIRGALTPFGLGREGLPPEAAPGSEAYLEGAGAFKEGAPLVEKEPGFAKTLEDFMETIITGPFAKTYKEYRGKRRGLAPPKEEAPKEGEITEENVITEMDTWDEEKVKTFQEMAKDEGMYEGEISGKLSQTTKDAMKKYYKKYPEQWEEVK